MPKNPQSGFAPLLLLLVVIPVIALGAFSVLKNGSSKEAKGQVTTETCSPPGTATCDPQGKPVKGSTSQPSDPSSIKSLKNLATNISLTGDAPQGLDIERKPV